MSGPRVTFLRKAKLRKRGSHEPLRWKATPELVESGSRDGEGSADPEDEHRHIRARRSGAGSKCGPHFYVRMFPSALDPPPSRPPERGPLRRRWRMVHSGGKRN